MDGVLTGYRSWMSWCVVALSIVVTAVFGLSGIRSMELFGLVGMLDGLAVILVFLEVGKLVFWGKRLGTGLFLGGVVIVGFFAIVVWWVA
jgi:hypothetical protein